MADLPSVPGVRHTFVSIGGARIHVALAGSGPALVLLHGWPQHWWSWRGQLPRLARDFTVVCPDIRGLGWSQDAGTDWSLRRLSTDLLELLDRLDIDRAGLVGHDWGSAIGYRFALDHPRRLNGYMPLGGLHPWSAIGGSSRIWWRPWHVYVLALNARLAHLPAIDVPAISLRTWRHVGAFSVAEAATYLRVMRGEAAIRATQHYYRAIVLREAPHFARHASRLHCEVPILHLLGAQDPLTQKVSDSWRRFAPRMALEQVPDCGHFLAEERPQLLGERIVDFFKAL